MAVQTEIYAENMGMGMYDNQDWFQLDNGCGGFNGLAFNVQPQQLQQQYQSVQFENQQQLKKEDRINFPVIATTTTTSSSVINHHRNDRIATATDDKSGKVLSLSLDQYVNVLLEKQRQEMDAYIALQNQRLKLAYQNYWKQQLRALEAKTGLLLKQKDQEIALTRKRGMELDEFVRKLEAENQLWQRVASENESMIFSLNATIEQLREKAAANNAPSNVVVDDAESCCSVEKEGRDDQRFGLVCCRCRSRNACVLFLPCRHLCSCVDCESFVDVCPVCNSVKQASIEALFS